MRGGRTETRPLRFGALLGIVAAVFLSACQAPRWPLEGPLTEGFGARWYGGPDLHRGVDVSAPVGTPVRPILSGRVRFAGSMRGYGNVIWIDHRGDVMSIYGHLSQIAVQVGQEVSQSTVIGRTGQSGMVTGPHLHLEVWRWGREVDPVAFLGGR